MSLKKHTAIPKKVKEKVYKRDRGKCIICGAAGFPNAHYIRRSQLGKGIEQNIVTLCHICHHEFDNGNKRKEYGCIIKKYLNKIYPKFTDEMRKYNKWT